MGGGVRGILVDSSVVLAAGEDGEASLTSGATYLLSKLRHSNIPTVFPSPFSYAPPPPPSNLSALKISFLERVAKLYSFDCFLLNPSSVDDTTNDVAQAWADNGGSFLHVVSDDKKNLLLNLSNCDWVIIVLGVKGSGMGKRSGMLLIDKLEELPLAICNLNKKALGMKTVTVGYIMKPSREEDFAKRGAFPLHPTQNGLIFVPLTFELPMLSQLREVDVVMHKATDEILSIEQKSSSEFLNKIIYTRGMQELQRCIEEQPDCCVIDPLENIYPVLDRLRIQQILLSLESLSTDSLCKIRGPHFLKVDNFDEPCLVQRLLDAKLFPPSIVKPQVACGIADAHSMAIVFKVDDYMGLNVPLPAVVQEYVDHSSTLFKFYVLGDKVFYAVRRSTPNADTLVKLSENNGLKPLLFDRYHLLSLPLVCLCTQCLKSLPTVKENQHSGVGDRHVANNQHLNLGLVTEAASYLRKMLDLTIFGFDVVGVLDDDGSRPAAKVDTAVASWSKTKPKNGEGEIQEGSGDHVIVDVNYLPSFKEVPDDVAIPAFWEAIKRKHDSRKINAQE
ncbi:hypothetical protein RJ639_008193 [Escallonia herrerae]|uniref:inositol-1,3,4-trisphosphate 5/6-kinase n=1 Tax=Escallonia herrerae TaxID=1293975 RepID=A0AA88VQN7_9ASTE|nr:hypothetical protein RJ639_008193 [Escallonia herrerae]